MPIINFNADTVDGFHASQTPSPNTIPVADASGKLASGWLPPLGFQNKVSFTSSGTWIVPNGVSRIFVIGWAGGGGGGGVMVQALVVGEAQVVVL